ncbi:hypothetical protein [Hymenobacter cheonanensis]|uniref:hypothetical protein n=1 Tax=Hymenobacter sp. CA2-7 TaxID=3063993 RepID=UPI0027139643|nr:hypothetical protein [Hymenobacter sp. CA2-7]MDO7888184.1 hypothetical protein [Hymenobacter sp. CA2-7]
MLTIADLKQLIHLGGGVHIDAGHYTTDDLKACALLAKGSGARIVLANAKCLTIADMKAIAHLGAGQIVFELVG